MRISRGGGSVGLCCLVRTLLPYLSPTVADSNDSYRVGVGGTLFVSYYIELQMIYMRLTISRDPILLGIGSKWRTDVKSLLGMLSQCRFIIYCFLIPLLGEGGGCSHCQQIEATISVFTEIYILNEYTYQLTK